MPQTVSKRSIWGVTVPGLLNQIQASAVGELFWVLRVFVGLLIRPTVCLSEKFENIRKIFEYKQIY
jgi:hypothetical protein